MDKLEILRTEIDSLDEKLVNLLNERAKVVVQIGKIKKTEENAPPIYAPSRERAVFNKIMACNKGPLPDRCLQAIYRELMSGSFFLERPLRIAFLGPEGSFSHNAAMLKFGQSVDYEPQTLIKGVFDEIARQRCDFGVVPVENNIAGGIIETLDALIHTSVAICSEMRMAIHHNLMANCPLEDIKRIYSKPEVFNQCRVWLNSTVPNADIIQSASTATAAQRVASEENAAAIGPRLAAKIYGLKVICENIEDNANNVTRFYIIGQESARPTGDDKTAIVFSTADKAGALADVLLAFRDQGVNLTNIESRPSPKGEKEYYFFADTQGHHTDPNVNAAIKTARNHCLQLSILGSFPKAQEVL
ncbi:MAG: prephenate dehydratase [Phycisphaerae bacterium]|nr:prephenate dehydratase [Phycisphaerae bacterium]